MNFDEYKKEYIIEAKKNGVNSNIIDQNLEYAKNIHDNGFPIIYDQFHFSLLVGYEYDFILGMSNATELFYREFTITQRNGKMRVVREPRPSLKEIQSWIKCNILDNINISPYAKAYRRGYSIKDNAKYHRGQKVIISVDIKNFFDNIKIKRVYRIFEACGYSRDVSVLLSKLCCLNDSLPQGAPTSPIISNIIMVPFDEKLAKLSISYKLRYTRYSDDITFSGDIDDTDCESVLRLINKIMNRKKLYLNESKTRVLHNYQRQVVTGIVVNEKMQISKNRRKQIRQAVHYIEKFGLESHVSRIGEKRSNYLAHLKGQIEHCLFINPKDTNMKNYYEVIKRYY